MNHQEQTNDRSNARSMAKAQRLAQVTMLGGICWLMISISLFTACAHVPSAHTISRDYGYRQTPTGSPAYQEDKPTYDDFVNGGHLYKMYCGSCHNARSLGERPFNETEVAFAHMRRHAYLTGKEYRQLVHFLRRWSDLGPPTPETETTPKRIFFSQPIAELRQKKEKK